MSIIPEPCWELLESQALAHLATLGPDGCPQCNPVWFGWDGEHVLISQTTQRQKYRNVQRDPHVALSIVDPHNPYRYLEIRGTVERIEEDTQRHFIHSMAKKYLGIDTLPEPPGGEERVILVIKPQRTSQMGYEMNNRNEENREHSTARPSPDRSGATSAG